MISDSNEQVSDFQGQSLGTGLDGGDWSLPSTEQTTQFSTQQQQYLPVGFAYADSNPLRSNVNLFEDEYQQVESFFSRLIPGTEFQFNPQTSNPECFVDGTLSKGQIQIELDQNNSSMVNYAYGESSWDPNGFNAQPSFMSQSTATFPAPVNNIPTSGLNNLSSFTQATTTYIAPANTPAQAVGVHRCSVNGCNKRFNRNGCRRRHEETHRNTRVLHVCTITGCTARYKRADKLTEHMWKKHADLGYVKAW